MREAHEGALQDLRSACERDERDVVAEAESAVPGGRLAEDVLLSVEARVAEAPALRRRRGGGRGVISRY